MTGKALRWGCGIGLLVPFVLLQMSVWRLGQSVGYSRELPLPDDPAALVEVRFYGDMVMRVPRAHIIRGELEPPGAKPEQNPQNRVFRLSMTIPLPPEFAPSEADKKYYLDRKLRLPGDFAVVEIDYVQGYSKKNAEEADESGCFSGRKCLFDLKLKKKFGLALYPGRHGCDMNSCLYFVNKYESYPIAIWFKEYQVRDNPSGALWHVLEAIEGFQVSP